MPRLVMSEYVVGVVPEKGDRIRKLVFTPDGHNEMVSAKNGTGKTSCVLAPMVYLFDATARIGTRGGLRRVLSGFPSDDPLSYYAVWALDDTAQDPLSETENALVTGFVANGRLKSQDGSVRLVYFLMPCPLASVQDGTLRQTLENLFLEQVGGPSRVRVRSYEAASNAVRKLVGPQNCFDGSRAGRDGWSSRLEEFGMFSARIWAPLMARVISGEGPGGVLHGVDGDEAKTSRAFLSKVLIPAIEEICYTDDQQAEEAAKLVEYARYLHGRSDEVRRRDILAAFSDCLSSSVVPLARTVGSSAAGLSDTLSYAMATDLALGKAADASAAEAARSRAEETSCGQQIDDVERRELSHAYWCAHDTDETTSTALADARKSSELAANTLAASARAHALASLSFASSQVVQATHIRDANAKALSALRTGEKAARLTQLAAELGTWYASQAASAAQAKTAASKTVDEALATRRGADKALEDARDAASKASSSLEVARTRAQDAEDDLASRLRDLGATSVHDTQAHSFSASLFKAAQKKADEDLAAAGRAASAASTKLDAATKEADEAEKTVTVESHAFSKAASAADAAALQLESAVKARADYARDGRVAPDSADECATQIGEWNEREREAAEDARAQERLQSDLARRLSELAAGIVHVPEKVLSALEGAGVAAQTGEAWLLGLDPDVRHTLVDRLSWLPSALILPDGTDPAQALSGTWAQGAYPVLHTSDLSELISGDAADPMSGHVVGLPYSEYLYDPEALRAALQVDKEEAERRSEAARNLESECRAQAKDLAALQVKLTAAGGSESAARELSESCAEAETAAKSRYDEAVGRKAELDVAVTACRQAKTDADAAVVSATSRVSAFSLAADKLKAYDTLMAGLAAAMAASQKATDDLLAARTSQQKAQDTYDAAQTALSEANRALETAKASSGRYPAPEEPAAIPEGFDAQSAATEYWALTGTLEAEQGPLAAKLHDAEDALTQAIEEQSRAHDAVSSLEDVSEEDIDAASACQSYDRALLDTAADALANARRINDAAALELESRTADHRRAHENLSKAVADFTRRFGEDVPYVAREDCGGSFAAERNALLARKSQARAAAVAAESRALSLQKAQQALSTDVAKTAPYDFEPAMASFAKDADKAVSDAKNPSDLVTKLAASLRETLHSFDKSMERLSGVLLRVRSTTHLDGIPTKSKAFLTRYDELSDSATEFASWVSDEDIPKELDILARKAASESKAVDSALNDPIKGLIANDLVSCTAKVVGLMRSAERVTGGLLRIEGIGGRGDSVQVPEFRVLVDKRVDSCAAELEQAISTGADEAALHARARAMVRSAGLVELWTTMDCCQGREYRPMFRTSRTGSTELLRLEKAVNQSSGEWDFALYIVIIYLVLLSKGAEATSRPDRSRTRSVPLLLDNPFTSISSREYIDRFFELLVENNIQLITVSCNPDDQVLAKCPYVARLFTSHHYMGNEVKAAPETPTYLDSAFMARIPAGVMSRLPLSI